MYVCRSRSVHDRYIKKHDHSRESRYNPEHYALEMYENKAAAIVQRWDSREDIDPFSGEAGPTGRPSRSAKKPTTALAQVAHMRYGGVLCTMGGGGGGGGLTYDLILPQHKGLSQVCNLHF